MSVTVGVIDYGSGNFASVWNALKYLNVSLVRVQEPSDLASATHLVLPGVGTFGAAMDCLDRMVVIEAIRERVLGDEVPFLGICVGMQLLATIGREFGDHVGLGLVPGVVDTLSVGDKGLNLPHIGWSESTIMRESPLLAGLGDNPSFYYLHSYAMRVDDDSDVILSCDYGHPFVAAVQRGNIFGVQFHPEKSQKHGLRLLRNFAQLDRQSP